MTNNNEKKNGELKKQIKIYNLFFLGITGIPVYLVIYQSNPLASWVIYEVCVLYGFLSTLAMQFIPKIYGIIWIDKFKNTSTAAIPPLKLTPLKWPILTLFYSNSLSLSSSSPSSSPSPSPSSSPSPSLSSSSWRWWLVIIIIYFKNRT